MKSIATHEQFAFANKAGVDAFTSLLNKSFTQFERLTALNLNTARSVLEDSVAATRSVLAFKTPQDLGSLQASLAQPILEKTVAYGRSVYEIVTEGQHEFAKLFETQVADLNKTFTDTLDKAAKSAPAGSEAAFSAVRSAHDAANSVYENVNKAAKQATEIAESNVAAVTEATVNAANTAVKSASAKKSA